MLEENGRGKMAWILIYWITYGGAATTTRTVDFSSQSACEAALAKMEGVKMKGYMGMYVYGICSPKE
jgi:hypothetical protein